MTKLRSALAGGLLLFALATDLRAETYTVTSEHDGDGIGSLRHAIALANVRPGPDRIAFAPRLAQTTLKLNGREIEITDTVTLAGPVPGTFSGLTIDAGHNSRIFNVTRADAVLTLEHLGLLRGRANTGRGGAVRSLGDVVLRHGLITLSNTRGDNGEGGGLWSRGTITLEHSVVSGNSTRGRDAQGGGLSARGDIVLVDSLVAVNSTWGENASGGGFVAGGQVTLLRSTVADNLTRGRASIGGGFNARGAVTLIDSTISGNTTRGRDADGGGIAAYRGVDLNHSTVTGNTTAGNAADGGGMFARGTVTLNHATVVGNAIAGDFARGGGIWADTAVTAFNSIVAGNASTAADPDIKGAVNQDGSRIGGNPGLGPLRDHGGPTLTRLPQPGSPAIDAGRNDRIPSDHADRDHDGDYAETRPYDQRGPGYDRIAGRIVDIGAVERNETVLNPAPRAILEHLEAPDIERDHIKLRVCFRDNALLQRASLQTDAVAIIAPDGSVTLPRLDTVVPDHDASELCADYRYTPSGGGWGNDDNGRYLIELGANSVRDFGEPALAPAPTRLETFDVALNRAPIVDAGGPYSLSEGGRLTLDASRSTSMDGDRLDLTWDLDGDGQYDDAVGEHPVVTLTELEALGLGVGSHTIGLRVDDGTGSDNAVSTASARLSLSNDGIAAAIENQSPNGGDGNNDGIVDGEQATVASLPNAVTGDYVTVSIVGSGCTLAEVTTLAADALAPDPEFEYPLGLVHFAAPCPRASVRLYFHGTKSLPPVFRAYGPTVPADSDTLGWYNASDLVTRVNSVINGVRVPTAAYVVHDGGWGDDDTDPARARGWLVATLGPAQQPGLVGLLAALPPPLLWGLGLGLLALVLIPIGWRLSRY